MYDMTDSGAAARSHEQSGFAELVSKRYAPHSDWSSIGSAEHFVQFYESDEYISEAVVEYMTHGLKSSETCILIATPEHIKGIETNLTKFGTDVEMAKANGSLLSIDAVEILSSFMIAGSLDSSLVKRIIGDMIRAAVTRGTQIRVFGEIVNVLCTRGDFEAAVSLEGLWNDLRAEYRFSLFCAYSMDVFTNNTSKEFLNSVCTEHAWTIPGESYAGLTSSKERLQKIAYLQQRNRQLEAELAHLETRIPARAHTI